MVKASKPKNPRDSRIACLVSDSLVETKADRAFVRKKMSSHCFGFFAKSASRTMVTTRTKSCVLVEGWCLSEGIEVKRITQKIPLDSIGSDQTSEGVQALFALWDASRAIFFWDYTEDHVMQALTAAWRMGSIVDMRIWIKHPDGKWRKHKQL